MNKDYWLGFWRGFTVGAAAAALFQFIVLVVKL
jgi:hypothetical protein